MYIFKESYYVSRDTFLKKEKKWHYRGLNWVQTERHWVFGGKETVVGENTFIGQVVINETSRSWPAQPLQDSARAAIQNHPPVAQFAEAGRVTAN